MGDIDKKLFEKESRGRWIDSGRRSGRTFRKLLSSLSLASGGETVIYLCPTQAAVTYTFDRAVEVLKVWMSTEKEVGVDRKKKHILFPGGGSLEISVPKDRYDHFPGETITPVMDLD